MTETVKQDGRNEKTKNRYNRLEWAGAFGDVGTLIPFVVAYMISVNYNTRQTTIKIPGN